MPSIGFTRVRTWGVGGGGEGGKGEGQGAVLWGVHKCGHANKRRHAKPQRQHRRPRLSSTGRAGRQGWQAGGARGGGRAPHVGRLVAVLVHPPAPNHGVGPSSVVPHYLAPAGGGVALGTKDGDVGVGWGRQQQGGRGDFVFQHPMRNNLLNRNSQLLNAHLTHPRADDTPPAPP